MSHSAPSSTDSYAQMPRSGELGKWIASHSNLLERVGWAKFLRCIRKRACLAKTVTQVAHPAAPLLRELRQQGAPVDYQEGTDWTAQQLEQARDRGSHQSASAYLGFLEGDMAEMVQKGFWTVLPYRLVQHLPGLRLAPMGVVPQRARRPRPIVDYSFYGQNTETLKLAPREAMQFGQALDRVLWHIWTAPKEHGPVHALKIDLSDGFYRIPVRNQGVARLGVIFPTAPQEEPLVAFPLVLPMGWTESPPLFCMATETVIDVTNHLLRHKRWSPPPHRLETLAATVRDPPASPPVSTLPPPKIDAARIRTTLPTEAAQVQPRRRSPQRRRRGPLAYVDVFVDDEIALGQGSPAELDTIRRTLLHVNDWILRPNHTDERHRKEPVSESKLKKGDGAWSTKKTLLGWDVDTLAMTIALPPHRHQRLLELLTSLQGKKRVSVLTWHKLLGELRSMVLAIPGGRGLFSSLQYALVTADRRRVRLTSAVRQALADWLSLAHSITTRPTRLAELFPARHPAYVGAHDAAASGMGGVWFPPASSSQPALAWRWKHPPHIRSNVVSFDNPRGTLTNSDLELGGRFAHLAVLAEHTDLAESTVVALGDNMAAVNWALKGSTTTAGPAAPLLRQMALHQRAHRYVVDTQYIPGPANSLADYLSRHPDSPDASLLAYLDSASPQPHGWRMLPATDNVWTKSWLPFIETLGAMDPFLAPLRDKVPVLMVFARRVRDGRSSRSGRPVRAAHVRDELHAVAKAYTRMGLGDPRLTNSGRLDPRLSDLFAAWSRQDPPPTRVKPLPIQVLHHAQALAAQAPNEHTRAAVDLAWIAFFYLLRPGEHCLTADNNPLCLRDVKLLIGHAPLDLLRAPLHDLLRATHSSLTFDTQKNRERGETIGHGRSGHSTACPTAALVRRITYLRLNGGSAETPLCAVRRGASWTHAAWSHVTSAHLLAILRTSAAALPQLHCPAADLSARSLRAGGAMALLCGHVDTDVIRLVGRWRSDAMFRYLHAQALPLVAPLASTILRHGSFTLLPGSDVPPHAAPLLAAALAPADP